MKTDKKLCKTALDYIEKYGVWNPAPIERVQKDHERFLDTCDKALSTIRESRRQRELREQSDKLLKGHKKVRKSSKGK